MRLHRKSAAVLATVISLTGGGGVAWACTGQNGSGGSGGYSTSTGSTDTSG